MQEDSEGFLYPVVGKDSCIDCDLCSKVCPVLNHIGEASEPKGVYAAKHKDLSTRTLSASGGAFSAAAKELIDRGGVVFGSVFNQDWVAEHKSAESMEEVLPMIGSKYMQSRIEGCYREAERLLKDGREVLFTGTSCQIKGLKLYLRKEYDNLFTADVICHGVPSPKVWRQWLKEEFQGKVLSVNFRDKGPSGWNNFHITIESEQGKVSGRVDENAYMRGFLNDLSSPILPRM